MQVTNVNSKNRASKAAGLLYSCSSSSSEGKLSLVFTSQLYGLKLSTYWFQRAKGLVHQVVVRFWTLLLG